MTIKEVGGEAKAPGLRFLSPADSMFATGLEEAGKLDLWC